MYWDVCAKEPNKRKIVRFTGFENGYLYYPKVISINPVRKLLVFDGVNALVVLVVAGIVKRTSIFLKDDDANVFGNASNISNRTDSTPRDILDTINNDIYCSY